MTDHAPCDPVADYLHHTPFAKFLGLQARMDERGLVLVLPFAPVLIGNPILPALHGGVLSALLETVARLRAFDPVSMDHLPKTIDLNIDYLHSGKPRDSFARARALKIGRRTATIVAEAWQENEAEPIAFLRAQFLLSRPESALESGS